MQNFRRKPHQQLIDHRYLLFFLFALQKAVRINNAPTIECICDKIGDSPVERQSSGSCCLLIDLRCDCHIDGFVEIDGLIGTCKDKPIQKSLFDV
jgi:hypothetical protein